jgi:predicted PurR-regulated permease PerM
MAEHGMVGRLLARARERWSSPGPAAPDNGVVGTVDASYAEVRSTPEPGVTVVHGVSSIHVTRAGLTLMALGLGVYFLWRIQEVLFLLFLAILLSTTIEPLVNYLRRGPFSRGTGVLVIYTVIIVVIGLPAVLVIPSLLTQASSFTENLPARIEALRPYAEGLRPTMLRDTADNGLNQLSAELRHPAPTQGDTLVAASATILHGILDFFMVFVLAFYWLLERNSLKRILLRSVPRHRARDVNLVWLELEEKFGAWVRGQLFLMLMIAVMAGVTFVLLGLPSPFILAIIAGLAEMIPIFGPYLAFAPAVLIALAVAPNKVLLVIGCAVVIQLIESNVLVPRVMRHNVGISSLTIILGIQAGAILYGLPGAFLAVPIAAAIQVILTHIFGADDRTEVRARAGARSADNADAAEKTLPG